MSVDLSLILPNDCYDINDNAHVLEVFNKAIARVKEYFGGREGFVENIEIYNSDSPNWREDFEPEDEDEPVQYSFDIPVLNVTCNLQQGYWDIWIIYRYTDYFWPNSKDINGNITLWPRNVAFEAARVFGFSEGWICDEYHSWNSLLDEDGETSFEKWLAYGKSEEDAKVYEFDLNMFGGSMKRVLDYQAKYHDNFRGCHSLAETYERMYPEYRPLVLETFEGLALTSRDKQLYLLNLETGESLLPYPIDAFQMNFGGTGFTVTKGTERAFFNREGEQLTEFREGGFSWKWRLGYHSHPLDQVVIDEATGRHFLTDGTDLPPEEVEALYQQQS